MAASSSLSPTLCLLSLSTSSQKPPKPSLSFSLLSSKHPQTSISWRAFAAPEAMESQQTLEPPPETPEDGLQGSEVSPLSVAADAEKFGQVAGVFGVQDQRSVIWKPFAA